MPKRHRPAADDTLARWSTEFPWAVCQGKDEEGWPMFRCAVCCESQEARRNVCAHVPQHEQHVCGING